MTLTSSFEKLAAWWGRMPPVVRWIGRALGFTFNALVFALNAWMLFGQNAVPRWATLLLFAIVGVIVWVWNPTKVAFVPDRAKPADWSEAP
jgi:hypothetical protein